MKLLKAVLCHSDLFAAWGALWESLLANACCSNWSYTVVHPVHMFLIDATCLKVQLIMYSFNFSVVGIWGWSYRKKYIVEKPWYTWNTSHYSIIPWWKSEHSLKCKLSLLHFAAIIILLNYFSYFISQVNRIKIPKQLDELVEMESESGNPVSKVLFRIKAEIHGVNIFLSTLSTSSIERAFVCCLSSFLLWLS